MKINPVSFGFLTIVLGLFLANKAHAQSDNAQTTAMLIQAKTLQNTIRAEMKSFRIIKSESSESTGRLSGASLMGIGGISGSLDAKAFERELDPRKGELYEVVVLDGNTMNLLALFKSKQIDQKPDLFNEGTLRFYQFLSQFSNSAAVLKHVDEELSNLNSILDKLDALSVAQPLNAERANLAKAIREWTLNSGAVVHSVSIREFVLDKIPIIFGSLTLAYPYHDISSSEEAERAIDSILGDKLSVRFMSFQ